METCDNIHVKLFHFERIRGVELIMNKNIYKPSILTILLITDLLWIFALIKFGELDLPVTILISVPIIVAFVIYLLGYMRFLKLKKAND